MKFDSINLKLHEGGFCECCGTLQKFQLTYMDGCEWCMDCMRCNSDVEFNQDFVDRANEMIDEFKVKKYIEEIEEITGKKVILKEID